MNKTGKNTLGSRRGRLCFLPLLILFIFFFSCHPETVEPDYKTASVLIKGRILPTTQVTLPVAVFIPGFQWFSTDVEGVFTIDIPLDNITDQPMELFAYSPPFSPVRFHEIRKDQLLLDETGIYHLGNISVSFERVIADVRNRVKGTVRLENQDLHPGILVLIEELGKTTTTRNDGEYLFYNIPEGNYTFHFFRESYKEYILRNVSIPVTDIYEISSVVLEKLDQEAVEARRGTIEGRARLMSSEGRTLRELESIKIRLINTPYETLTDRLGGFRFTNIPYGNYFFEASFTGFDSYSTSFYLSTASLSLPQITLNEYDTPHYGTLQGSVIYPDDIPDFTIVALKGTQIVGLVDTRGTYTLENVSPGIYDLLIKAEGFKPLSLPQINVRPNVVTNIPAVNLETVEDPPQVVNTQPSDGQSNVGVRRQIDTYIVFNKKMDIPSTKRAISISPLVTHNLFMGKEHPNSDWDTAYLVLYAGNVANPVEFNKTYTVTVSKNARDLDNNLLEEEYVFSFTTGRGRILYTTPRNQQSNVPVLGVNRIEFHFNCKINEDSFKRAFRISPSSHDTPFFSFYQTEEDWSVAVVEVSLDYNNKYQIFLSNALQSWDRNSLENTPYTLEFDTYTRNEENLY